MATRNRVQPMHFRQQASRRFEFSLRNAWYFWQCNAALCPKLLTETTQQSLWPTLLLTFLSVM